MQKQHVLGIILASKIYEVSQFTYSLRANHIVLSSQDLKPSETGTVDCPILFRWRGGESSYKEESVIDVDREVR